ncbi:benzoylformate decarboxylase [Murinocardiopsis flavida]|uniref:Benzoylformate decarboxylase n=1 Tax=Murinocardiopsis flavida TaxID=645275 RepID=A0A2P8DNV2_9ACTN|nr:benzoylformate decarboxylase [Murinocardiopsis flavida]
MRDAAFGVMREYGLTTVFTNPGSTEIPFLTDLPEDLRVVLGLHEGSVVGMATGWAIARDRPALVLLHTTAGLGNAVGALATARVNRAPLVVLVGQQDRRHLALEPFLTGRLRGMAGDYPVSVAEPARADDVPAAIARAHHAAVHERGPALVVVPMDDWAAPADPAAVRAAPARAVTSAAPDDAAVAEVAALLNAAASPVLVAGAGNDTGAGWAALTVLAERLGCPVYQEAFAARAGFPQDHPAFAGMLPADRPRLRALLGGHDTVLAVGAPAFRQYAYTEGPLVRPGTRVAVVGDDPAQARHSAADLTVVTAIAPFVDRLAERVRARPGGPPGGVPARDPASSVAGAPRDSAAARPSGDAGTSPARHPARPAPGGPPGGAPLDPAHVLGALAERVTPDTVIVEETPSSRPELHALLPARRPLGFLSAAMGGLGFAVPAAIGLRMADPERPVVAVVGDGSCLYQVQALWSAARYGAGVLFVVLANGRYAVMDRLAEQHGGKPSWPGFEDVSVSALAAGLSCPARRITDWTGLTAALDRAVPTLAHRTEPLLLDVAVTAGTTFSP